MAALSAIYPATGESAETPERRSHVIPSWETQEGVPPQEARAGSVQSSNLIAALWPAAPQAGNVSSLQPNQPPSVSDPGQNATFLDAAKGDSPRAQSAWKLAGLSGDGFADAGLGVPKAGAYATTKQGEQLLPGRYGRVAGDESLFHEEKGTALSLYQREQALSPVRRSFSSEQVSPGEGRGYHLFPRPRGKAASGEFENVLGLLAADLARDPSSSRLVMKSGLDARAVERLFSSMGRGLLDIFLPGSEQTLLPRQALVLPLSYPDTLPGLGPPPGQTTQPMKGQQSDGGNAISVLPWYLSVVLYRPSGKPLDPSAQQGLERLCAYAWYSIHHAERVHGEKFHSPEDVVQEIYLEWRGLVGPQAEDAALCRLLENGSEEMRFLRVAVQRVIGRARYQQKQWAKEVALSQLAGSTSAFARPGGQERIDWEDLWQNVVSTLGPQEKQILEMRKEGRTYAEIGASLGMAKQRVCENYHRVVSQLQKSYPDWVGYHT
jgi:DNA-directed RNA polymerase specialized sigma24 family protein